MRRQVEAMAAYGVAETDIASVIGIDAKTLRKHYRSELDHGHVKANTRVAESLFRKATGDGSQSVTAAIFWLKTRARWKETSAFEHTGLDGSPIVLNVITGVPRAQPRPSARRSEQPKAPRENAKAVGAAAQGR